jgi:hypothetical protein
MKGEAEVTGSRGVAFGVRGSVFHFLLFFSLVERGASAIGGILDKKNK